MLVATAGLIALTVSGCSAEVKRGFLPGYDDGPVTNMTDRITNLWVGSWIAALIVGVLVWGLTIWCVIAYRKKKGDNKLPVQTRYHLPLEILYTVVPIVMVGVLFFYTQRDMEAIRDTSATPDVEIEVYGKQWSWDFNYLSNNVYETGTHIANVGELEGSLGAPGTHKDLPDLYLPVNETIEFTLVSRDVNHSFWIPAFLDKMDLIPGRTNTWQVKPLREGVYAGKCAELCGEFHSGMLFNVKVVSRDVYEAEMAKLAEKGQTGRLGDDLNRYPSVTSSTEGSDN
ncbi:aa3-type cytochrome oxidase subunit II [Timonella sp. A28]|uniref:aa3-type cytochrome oxidase subunit II n=1 Tax=Timonella sp. A28 TaxID=3442640 RepID=UPI003EBDFC03